MLWHPFRKSEFIFTTLESTDVCLRDCRTAYQASNVFISS